MKFFPKILLVVMLTLAISGPSWSKPSGLVVGYSAAWFDGIYPPESYNYDALSHIMRSFLIPKPNGDIDIMGGFFDAKLEKMAHAHGVKLIASIGGASGNANHWLSMANNPDSEKHFFDGLGKLITANHFDGVDIDWEPSALTDADQKAYTKFMKDLRKRFPGWIITTALGGGEYWAKHISWSDIVANVDFINLMTYDFSGAWTGHSGHNANLYDPKDPKVNTATSIDEMVSRLQKKYKVPSDKIALGLPFYGSRFSTKHMGDKFSSGPSEGDREIQYYELSTLIADKNFKDFWDEGAQVPYLERLDGNLTISYDSIKAIQIKCEYAKDKKLGGVMIWNLGADIVGDQTPLLDAVAQSFGVKPMTMPLRGMEKTLESFGTLVQTAYNQAVTARNMLAAAGKTEAAQAADPRTAPDLRIPSSKNRKVLAKKLTTLAKLLSSYDLRVQDARPVLNSVSIPEVKGDSVAGGNGNKLLMDDFEKGTVTNLLQGHWETGCDQNKLGTVLDPRPFKPSKGGHDGAESFAAHIWGHYGKSQAPWPYAMLLGTLKASGGAVDLSAFKSVEFWVKGDGKTYSVILGRAAVQDSCNFRKDFKSTTDWAKVTLKLADFAQPSWGKQVPFKSSDALSLAFSPAASFSDEDFNLWVDDVSFVR